MKAPSWNKVDLTSSETHVVADEEGVIERISIIIL